MLRKRLGGFQKLRKALCVFWRRIVDHREAFRLSSDVGVKGVRITGVVRGERRKMAHQSLAHAGRRRFTRKRGDGRRSGRGDARFGGRNGFVVGFRREERGLCGLHVRGQKLERPVDGLKSGVNALESSGGRPPAVDLLGLQSELSRPFRLKSGIVPSLLLRGDDRRVNAVRQVRDERGEPHAFGAQLDGLPSEPFFEKAATVALSGRDDVAQPLHRGAEGRILNVVENAGDGGCADG